MITVESDSFDEMHQRVIKEFLANHKVGDTVSASLKLLDPYARVSTSDALGMPYGTLCGRYIRDVEDGLRDPRWVKAKKKLVDIFGSQDAVITVGKDIVLYFSIRDSKLLLDVALTSCDAVFGLASNVFSMTLVQELMLLDVKNSHPVSKLGSCTITVGKLSLPEHYYKTAVRVADEKLGTRAYMPPIRSVDDLFALYKDEKALREWGMVSDGAYRGGARWMFDQLLAYRLLVDSAMTLSKRPRTVIARA